MPATYTLPPSVVIIAAFVFASGIGVGEKPASLYFGNVV
jgi:hypothetical protein